MSQKNAFYAQSGGVTAAEGLYFMGFDETVRGQLFEINRGSRCLAREIQRYLRA